MSKLLFDGPETAAWTLVLAHGAGQGMDSEFLTAFAKGLATRGTNIGGLRVVRFEFPYMQAIGRGGKRRPPDREAVLIDAWHAVINSLSDHGVSRKRLVIGGKSLGGRIASLIADQAGVAGLICLGYPFHPPGRPTKTRTEHLKQLRTPTLICQGTRDPFGDPMQVQDYELSDSIRFCWLEDGDHGFKPRKASGLTEKDHRVKAIDAIVGFVGGLPQ